MDQNESKQNIRNPKSEKESNKHSEKEQETEDYLEERGYPSEILGKKTDE